MADFLARLSFWRFVGLSLLVLIAASIASDLLSGKEHRPHKQVVVVEKEAAPRDNAAPATPATPKTKGERIDIRIGRSGITFQDGNETTSLDGQMGKKSGDITEDDDEPSSSSPLPVFLVLLMLIARFVATSKLKAEAQTVVARDIAERETLSRQLAEARLQAMQAQVEPHFLFNTLAAVEHLIETDPPRAAKMQSNLIGYLRSVMPNFRKPESTLGREVEICRHYLDILKVRMEDRLQVEIEVPRELANAPLPPLMLQSLVENAIRHGLEPKPAGGSLHIRAEALDGRLAVTVIDTGIGFARPWPARSRAREASG